VPFEVGSPKQREALLDACDTAEDRERGSRQEEADSERYDGRVAAVVALEQQLDQGSPTVDQRLVIAGAITQELIPRQLGVGAAPREPQHTRPKGR